MAITMDQLKGLMSTPRLSGRIAIDSPYGTPQVEKTGIGHFLKTFFGFKSAKAKNEATLNAIRTAFRDDPKLMVGYDRAESMLSSVKGTITDFTIVASADGGSFERSTLEAALMMNLFGAETGKGHLGLFGDSLFLSKDVVLDGATPEELAERLLAFSRLADDIEKQFGSEGGG